MARAPLFDEGAAWRAVLARDRRADGRLVYAVTSTGVFCRPSCPSRRPHPRHVRFFPSPDEARRAGFRPCLRCLPESACPPAVQRVQSAREYLDAHLGEAVTLARLGREVGMSPCHLQRTFKRLMGVTPRGYVDRRRLERLKSGLRRGDRVVTAIYAAGYGSGSRVYERSDAWLGMTPATYRRGGRGMQIRFTVVTTPFGRLLVAATGRGVCAVMLGEREAPLESALRCEYPDATIERADDHLREWADAVARYAGGTLGRLNLPLDVQATAFQYQVWQAIRSAWQALLGSPRPRRPEPVDARPR